MASRDAWVFRQGRLWAADLTAPTSGPLAARLPARIGPVEGDAIPDLVSVVRQMDPITPDALARRFESGCQCFAAWVDGSVAAYGWLTRGPEWVGEFERRLNVQADEAYIWDCATVPAYRRQRLFTVLVSHVAAHLRQEGLRRLWIIGLVVAPPLIRAVAAAGFEPVMGLTYLRLGKRRALLTARLPGAASPQVQAACRLLQAEGEQAVGPLIVGNSSRPRPPDTHFDR